MAAPLLYTELADDEFDIENEALEAIDNTQPGGGVHFSGNSQEATLSFYIPANKIRSAMRAFLGYSYADDGDGDSPSFALHRELPHRHPEFPNLWAFTASAVKIAPKSEEDNENGEPYLFSPFLDGENRLLYYASYQMALITVRYKSFGRMRFLPDSDIGDYTDEYKRYVRFNFEPSIEALQAEGVSNLKFKETSAAAAGVAAGPVVGTAYPAPLPELMAKAGFTLTWYDVPHNYLSSDPDINLMDQILGRQSTSLANFITCKLGTVSADYFLGYRPGELLLKAVKAEEVLYPVTTADNFEIAGGWTLTFVFEFFSPPKGKEDSPPGTSPYWGHDLYPYRVNGKWYYCSREDGFTGLLPRTNFWEIFRHQADVQG